MQGLGFAFVLLCWLFTGRDCMKPVVTAIPSRVNYLTFSGSDVNICCSRKSLPKGEANPLPSGRVCVPQRANLTIVCNRTVTTDRYGQAETWSCNNPHLLTAKYFWQNIIDNQTRYQYGYSDAPECRKEVSEEILLVTSVLVTMFVTSFPIYFLLLKLFK